MLQLACVLLGLIGGIGNISQLKGLYFAVYILPFSPQSAVYDPQSVDRIKTLVQNKLSYTVKL